MNNQILTSIIILVFLAIPAVAGYTTLNGYVTDNAGQITPKYQAQINEKIKQIEANTSVEIAVLTVKDMSGATIEQFSIDVAQGNGVGKKGKDNGILITVAQAERKWRIEVGYGLEGVLTDAQAKIIGERYLKPKLAAGNWGAGIYDTLTQIEAEINKEPTPEPTVTGQGSNSDWFVWFLVAALFGLLLISAISTGSNSSKETRRRRREYSGSYHSSGRNDTSESLESDTVHHSYYSGSYDSGSDSDGSIDSDGGFGGFGGGSFGGGGAGGGF